MIPKYIFQTHDANYIDLPDFMKELSNTWINLNPGYQYIYMNAIERRKYIEDNYPVLLDLFDVVPVQYKSDLWRYCILYDNGGIYADTDSVCVQSIDNAVKQMTTNQEMICSSIGYSQIFQGLNYKKIRAINNANFAAIKNSYILEKVIKNITEFCIKQNGNFNYINPIAPWAASYSETVLDNEDKALFLNHEFFLHGDDFKKDSSIVRNTFYVKYFDQTVEYKDLFKLL